MIADNFTGGDRQPGADFFNQVARAVNRAAELKRSVYNDRTVPDKNHTERLVIPVLNRLDQDALNNYVITVNANICPPHNGAGVVRKGIQFNDIFRVGESDDYYKYTFNGWKLYAGKFHQDHLYRRVPEYAVVTPAMTGQKSAQQSDCEPVYKVRGTNITKCGNWLVSSEGSSRDGHYMIFNTAADGSGLYSEGWGRATVSCAACWAILRIDHADGTSTVSIFGEESTEAIWSTTLTTGQSFSLNPVSGYGDVRDGDGGKHFYMFIRQGAQVTILCCNALVGSWSTSYSYGGSNNRIVASVSFQKYIGVYEGSTVYVIEGCEIVWTGCGRLGSLWGIPNSLVFSCKSTGCLKLSHDVAVINGRSPGCMRK